LQLFPGADKQLEGIFVPRQKWTSDGRGDGLGGIDIVVPDSIPRIAAAIEPQPGCAKLTWASAERQSTAAPTWEKCALWVQPNSTMYWFGTNPANSDMVVANSPIVQAAASQGHEPRNSSIPCCA
jgi:hypothetical protein